MSLASFFFFLIRWRNALCLNDSLMLTKARPRGGPDRPSLACWEASHRIRDDISLILTLKFSNGTFKYVFKMSGSVLFLDINHPCCPLQGSFAHSSRVSLKSSCGLPQAERLLGLHQEKGRYLRSKSSLPEGFLHFEMRSKTKQKTTKIFLIRMGWKGKRLVHSNYFTST